ncbi:MAG: hypothetical protein WBQ23_01730 [Bacteroidota bacterium]
MLAKNRLRFYRQLCAPVIVLSGEIEYRLTEAEDFPWESQPMPQHNAVYRQRFADGEQALIGSSGGEIVFIAWVERKSLRIDELAWRWNLQDAEAVVYDVVTMDAWRGRGIYPAALRRLCGLLAEDGIRHLWIYAEEENSSSLRGIEKALFEYRGSITAKKIFGMTLRQGTVKGVNA